MALKLLIHLALAAIAVPSCMSLDVAPVSSSFGKCGMDANHDPQYHHMKQIGFHSIDLDLPPKQRWKKIAHTYSAQLQDLVHTFKSSAGILSQAMFKIVEAVGKADAEDLLNAMPAPYGDEIRGVAEGAGLTKLDAFLCNIVYEISGACSVIIAQGKDGKIVHGHNLDTAANWNFTSGQWVLAEKLRAITSNVHFKKGGKTLFNSTSYIGYTGVFEGMKAGAFSVSANTRFDLTFYHSLLQWITGRKRTGHFATHQLRNALAEDKSFSAAVKRLNSVELLGPGYLAVAGTKPGEGAIMSRGATASYHFWSLKDELTKGKNYMVQTNWDHWLPDPIFDRRRVPAEACMDSLSKDHISFPKFFQVLAAKPTRNKMTCHTAMFSAREGKMESYQQYCEERGCRPAAEVTEKVLV